MYKNPIEHSEAVFRLASQLKHDNNQLIFHNNQIEFSEVIEKSGKSKLGVNLNLALNTLSPACFFGLTVHESEGNCVACVSARKDNLGGQSLGEFLKKYFQRICTSQSGMVELAEVQPFHARQPMHEVAYIGELWVAPAHRNLKLAKAIVKMAILLSLQIWAVDYIYALLSAKHMRVGPSQYGWTRAYPRALNWNTESIEIPADAGFVAITGDEASDLARNIIDEQGLHTKTR
ncbi:hypothetical protein ACQU0X_30910 [Pseudovibrio ascidiaceicola]|uniref:hypothetical protein n=1 Tax=Pseudovibrio ascidiaceicola TaxID=285279 RepID=UPI003D35D25B